MYCIRKVPKTTINFVTFVTGVEPTSWGLLTPLFIKVQNICKEVEGLVDIVPLKQVKMTTIQQIQRHTAAQGGYCKKAKDSTEMPKVEPCQLPDKPNALKKIMPELKMDKAEIKTKDQTRPD